LILLQRKHRNRGRVLVEGEPTARRHNGAKGTDMAHFEEDDIAPVTRITAGAVGEPGRRVFLLQAHMLGQAVTWVIEKEQAAALTKVIPRLLADVQDEFPELSAPLVAAKPNLALSEPLEPLFRVGGLSLSYDRLHDLIVLTLAQAEPDEDVMEEEEDVEEETAELQIFATRGQALLLSQQAGLVIAAGRPPCPSCGEPMDDFGHFCLPPVANRRWNSDYLQ
jgi:uncharacterized repeat protein (TIGR03847 family)